MLPYFHAKEEWSCVAVKLRLLHFEFLSNAYFILLFVWAIPHTRSATY